MHVTKKVGIAALAGTSLLALSLPFAVITRAQQDKPVADQQGFGQGEVPPPQGGRYQGQPPQGGFQGAQPIPAPGFGGQGGRGGFAGVGGASAMESDNMFLYVMQGNTIFKIGKADLKVISQMQLPAPMVLRAPEPVRAPGGSSEKP